MKKTIFLVVLALGFFACDNDYETVNSNGNIVTQTLSVDNFTGIFLDSGCDVILKNGTTQKVTVKASDNIIDQINLNVDSDGIWLIDFKSGDNIATINNHLWEITIESPNITSIKNDGSGSITCMDTLTASALSVTHLSSGNINLLCNTNALTTFFDAGGNITASGRATTNNFTKEGGGEFRAFNLDVDSYTMTKDGGGKCEIKANTAISGTIDGGGNVYYKGMPTISVQVNGGGQLIDAN